MIKEAPGRSGKVPQDRSDGPEPAGVSGRLSVWKRTLVLFSAGLATSSLAGCGIRSATTEGGSNATTVTGQGTRTPTPDTSTSLNKSPSSSPSPSEIPPPTVIYSCPPSPSSSPESPKPSPSEFAPNSPYIDPAPFTVASEHNYSDVASQIAENMKGSTPTPHEVDTIKKLLLFYNHGSDKNFLTTGTQLKIPVFQVRSDALIGANNGFIPGANDYTQEDVNSLISAVNDYTINKAPGSPGDWSSPEAQQINSFLITVSRIDNVFQNTPPQFV